MAPQVSASVLMGDYTALVKIGLTLDDDKLVRIVKSMVHDCLAHAQWSDFCTKVYFFCVKNIQNAPVALFASQSFVMLQKILKNVPVAKVMYWAAQGLASKAYFTS